MEAEGLATIALGSQRQQITGTAPPRGLWCDFPLGRPLGRPGDAEFQHRVLARAFGLLDSPTPIVDIYPDVIHDDSTEILACPMPPHYVKDEHPAVSEARALRPAYERAVRRFGNRVGAGRVVTADDIPAAVQSFVRVEQGVPWKEAGIPGVPARVAQDIRGYYETAVLGLADHVPPAWAGAHWFYDQTEAGKIVLAARAAMRDADVKQPIWFYMAPGDR